MLATDPRLRDLDIAGPLTRIMGVGFTTNGGQPVVNENVPGCHVPSLSNDPEYVGDVNDLGRFWYIADSLPKDLSKIELEPSIWSVLTCILWNIDQKTLKDIRTANGRVWPPPPLPLAMQPFTGTHLVTGTHIPSTDSDTQIPSTDTHTPSTSRITINSLLNNNQ